MFLSYSIFSRSALPHHDTCRRYRDRRQTKLGSLSSIFSQPLSEEEERVHSLGLLDLVKESREGRVNGKDVARAYGFNSNRAQELSNCLSEIMVDDYLARQTASDQEKPALLNVPVSIKDAIDIAGHPTTLGFSKRFSSPTPPRSSTMVQLLQRSGALIHVKTTNPTGLLSVETNSHLFGLTTNPHNSRLTVGASGGGGAALLASGGSMIEVGSDIGGSLRIPAHCCGLYSLKGSYGRFPETGAQNSLPGFEGIKITSGVMTRSLEDLTVFYKKIVEMKPWEVDYECVPVPWREAKLEERKLRFGVLWSDGVIPPTPACRRALATAVSALQQEGHECVDLSPKTLPSETLCYAYQLAFADAGSQLHSQLSPGEPLSPSLASFLSVVNLPYYYKRFLSFLGLAPDYLPLYHRKSIEEERELVQRRDEIRAEWFEMLNHELEVDFILTVPYPLPAHRHPENDKGKGREDSERVGLASAGYCFLFNFLDLPAAHVPSVIRFSPSLDAVPSGCTTSTETFDADAYSSMGAEGKNVWRVYEDCLEDGVWEPSLYGNGGLGIGVQLVGTRRFDEEKVLEGCRVLDRCLGRH